MTRTPLWLAAALLLFPLFAADAHAGVDVEVDLNARVKVSHDPEFEVGRFRFDATQGTALNITVSAIGRRSPLDFTLLLRDPDDQVVDMATEAKRFVDRDKRVIVKGLVAQATGEYVLEVTATGTGPYVMRLKGNPQRTWRDDVDDLGAAGDTEFDFSAPAGSRVILRAVAPRGSAATPRFTNFLGDDLSATGRTTAKMHTVPVAPLSTGDSGDLTVGLRNDADDAGDVDFTAIVRPARARLQNLDLRSNRLGAASGNEAAKSATVDDLGGVVEIDDPSSDADGAGVNVPAGALPIPTRITVTSAADLPPEADQQAGGPAIEFGPEGLEFVNEATITLPLNLSALPVGTQPGDILVIKVEADGTRTTIVPDSVDLVIGTATVPITSFSIYQANVPVGPPTLKGRDYWFAAIGGELGDDQNQQSDSRDRNVFGEVGTMSVRGDEFESSAVSFFTDEKEVSFFHDDAAAAQVTRDQSFDTFRSASWNYFSASSNEIEISDGGEVADVFNISEDGSILIHAPSDTFGLENEASLEIIIERPRSTPSMASVAGNYWIAGIAFDAFDPLSGTQPLNLGVSRFFGSATLGANGTYSVTNTEFFKEYRPEPGRQEFEEGKESERERGTYVVETGEVMTGSLVLMANDAEEGETVRLLPSKDRNIMLGMVDVAENCVELVVLVRKSANLKRSTVTDNYAGVAFGFEELDTYSIVTQTGPVDVPDFLVFSGNGKVEVGTTIALTDFQEICIERDVSVSPGGVRVARFGPFTDTPMPLTVFRTGKIQFFEDEDDEVLKIVGAFTPDGMFGFFMDDPGPDSDAFALDVFVRPPPPPDPR